MDTSAKKGPKVLLFDIESAGVQGLCADRAFVVCFGYKFLGDPKTHCLTILDHPGKDPHDDKPLLREAVKILNQADGLVAHYGEKFDKPFLQARLIRAGLEPISENKLTDTCLIARGRLKLSSNRLGNLAAFLGLKEQKQEKRGGWPSWWMGALIGDKKSIRAMADYCKQDVRCLEQVYLAMRHIIPTRYLPINMAIGKATWACASCGGRRKQDRGWYFSDKKMWKRYQCQSCGKWSHAAKASDRTAIV